MSKNIIFFCFKMSGKKVQIMSYKQHIMPNSPITKPEYKHPTTHKKENIFVTDGSSKRINAKELILYKNDVNSY